MKKRVTSLMTLLLACSFAFVGCGKDNDNSGSDSGNTPGQTYDNETTPLRLSIQPVEGLFSPFFSTAGTDSTVVGMTQLSMLTTNAEGEISFGDDQPCVVKDYSVQLKDKNGNVSQKGDEDGSTTYQFVIKNNVKFSDGTPLTIKDVLFNLYVYLDPVYTGSSTIYSTAIQGLTEYRSLGLNSDENEESALDTTARVQAQARLDNMEDYLTKKGASDGSALTDAEVKQAEADCKALAELFAKELESDWTSAGESLENYQKEYNITKQWEAFLFQEGVTQILYKNGKPSKTPDGKYEIDNSAISGGELTSYEKDAMIDFVYGYYQADNIRRGQAKKFAEIMGWASGSTLKDNIQAEERSKKIDDIKQTGDYPHEVSGIRVVSGSNFVSTDESLSDSGYSGDYDVLQVTINGVDPKAIWNFGFTVAPMHYYSDASVTSKYGETEDYHAFNAPGVNGYDEKKEINFGFPMGDYKYFTEVIQSKNKVPMGAGVYRATTVDGSADFNKLKDGFYDNSMIYYQRNDYFHTCFGDGKDTSYNAKIKYVRYKVVDTTNVMNSLLTGSIDYADVQATQDNINQIDKNSSFLGKEMTKTNGYGYIGINASKIPDINIRRAIMSVMDVSLVKSYYPGTLSSLLSVPMTTCSWVYNNADGTTWEPTAKYAYRVKQGDALNNLNDYNMYMAAAANSCGAEKGADGYWYYYPDGVKKPLQFTFTIAGNTDDHPAYQTLSAAMEVLNNEGWQISINPDSRALTKLASGSLTLWCAAWSSTIDPDMYQVYHMDSKASSIKAWGYSYILDHPDSEDYGILEELSGLIDAGRETLDQQARTATYREALALVMDLAIELPTYQRNDLYAFNTTVLDRKSMNATPTTYSSPIDKLWNLSYVGN